jgi:SAM-dependent methyltransferase
VRALDVATGGGHVAKRLAAAGCEVTTCDAAAGMEPDVVCPAEELAFADASFDVVVCRLAGHHFDDLQAALKEMARVSRRLVVLEDTLYSDERVEQAEKLRDATHVRAYSEAEWRAFIAAAGLQIVKGASFEKRHQMGEWLALTGCSGDTAERVRGLLVHRRVSGGAWTDTKVLFKCRKREAP